MTAAAAGSSSQPVEAPATPLVQTEERLLSALIQTEKRLHSRHDKTQDMMQVRRPPVAMPRARLTLVCRVAGRPI